MKRHDHVGSLESEEDHKVQALAEVLLTVDGRDSSSQWCSPGGWKMPHTHECMCSNKDYVPR